MSVYSGIMLHPLILILLAFGVGRWVILLVSDKITAPIRTWVVTKSGEDGFWTFGWHCPWCQGVWWSGVFTSITYAAMPVPFTFANVWLGFLTFLAVAFAGSYLADR